jgi:hypothetical protein
MDCRGQIPQLEVRKLLKALAAFVVSPTRFGSEGVSRQPPADERRTLEALRRCCCTRFLPFWLLALDVVLPSQHLFPPQEHNPAILG